VSEAPAPTAAARETAEIHSRLLKCALEIPESRAYWEHVGPGDPAPSTERAFEEGWFGRKSHARVAVLLTNFRARFYDFPDALRALRRWGSISPEDRALVCHWHTQLTDPMYRAFTGDFLPDRLVPQITHARAVEWVEAQALDRFAPATQVQFASKLLSAAHAVGIVQGTRDPRPLGSPRVSEAAVSYLLYLLRDIGFGGSLLDNPYVRSVGLGGGMVEDRLRNARAFAFRRSANVVDPGWRYPNLLAWAEAQ
jgi:hypothetical protein